MIPVSSFSSSEEICAICVGRNSNNATHCGILYSIPTEDGTGKKYFFLHQGSPLNLFNDPEQDLPNWKGYLSAYSKYSWLPFDNVPSQLKNLIVSACTVIAEKNEQLTYGIFFCEGTHIDKFGEVHLGDSDGLTCSTLVKVVLSNLGVEIINDPDWPNDRPDDLEWAKSMLTEWKAAVKQLEIQLTAIRNRIRIHPNERDHLSPFRDKLIKKIQVLKEAIIRTEDGITNPYFERYRPEEIAAASYHNFERLPLKFEYDCGCPGVKMLSEHLVQHLH